MSNVPDESRVSRRIQEGFTLIELMIVVAIVAILSAIAMPQYQIYTGKAQLAEGIYQTEARKAVIVELLATGAALSTINGGVGSIPANITGGLGRYVDSMVIDAGSIVVTMKSTGVSPCVTGATVTLAPIPPTVADLAVSWVCTSNAMCRPLTCS